MEKVTFKYEAPGNEYSNINEVVEMVFDSEGMTISELAERFEHFALAIGYHPDSVKNVFNEE